MNNAVIKLIGNSLGELDQVPKSSLIASMVGLLRGLGPYLLVELILPGGTLLALLLWLYRRRLPVVLKEIPRS